ncbi:MAG: transglycosylase SLT domain-containing protein, partial [Bdellovibrionales bacterium]
AAWQTMDKLQQEASWLSVAARADQYRWAGELAIIEQNLGGAQSFLQRSLRERENSELRARVESIRSTLLGKKKEEDKAQVEEKLAGDLGISEEEKKIFERMNRAFESLDYVSAVEDAMNLLQQFPGSTNASEAADKVQNVYLSLATKTDERFRHVRERVVKEMSKGDAGRLSRWATSAYARGLYIDALNLAERAHEKYAGHPDSTRILLLAGKAAVAAGEYKSAQSHFESLVKQHGGTEEAAEATFRLGLIAYRLKQFPQAAAFFERLLAMSHGDDFEYRALYWQWRARQKIDAEKSSAYALPLITKYPLSYYGLRAQAETNGNQLQLSDKPLKVKVELRLLESERLAWERLTMLLKAGWFKEAENEIQALPQPQSPEEHLVRAKVWAAAFRYDNAIINMNKAFDTNPELLQLSVLRIVFPHEYSTWTAKEAKAVGLSEDLLRALIRQESSFRAEAQSSANALGVMQLLPSTAAEIARDLRMRNVEFPQALLKPDVNIRLGANYLYRMVKAFSGHVPLGLAAYNAGIGRMRRWLSSRPEIGALEGSPSSSPEAEVWLDELPWEETSFYVKAILRNWMIYRLLDGSKLSLSDPIWLDAKAGSR